MNVSYFKSGFFWDIILSKAIDCLVVCLLLKISIPKEFNFGKLSKLVRNFYMIVASILKSLTIISKFIRDSIFDSLLD